MKCIVKAKCSKDSFLKSTSYSIDCKYKWGYTYGFYERKIDAEIDKFDIETDVYAEAFHGIYYRQQREEERNEITKKAYPYQINRKNCAAEFNSLRRSIISMRSDSVLCK